MQIVSHGKHNLMLAMDELLALVLVTHMDVTLLGLLLPSSAGGTKGRDSSSTTTSDNPPCALQCNALLLLLHLECTDCSFALSQAVIGKHRVQGNGHRDRLLH